jgi:hypothetical protein
MKFKVTKKLEILLKEKESKLVLGISLGNGVLLWWNEEGSSSNVLEEWKSQSRSSKSPSEASNASYTCKQIG